MNSNTTEDRRAYSAWLEQAACAGMLNLFYADDGEQAHSYRRKFAQAKQVCAACPVRRECLDAEMEAEAGNTRFGVWGGLTPGERRRLAAS